MLVFVRLAALYQNLHHRVVVRFHDMVRSLRVVRISASLEQQPCHSRMLRNPRCAINRALPLRMRLMINFHPPGIRARSRIQQRLRRRDETVRSRPIEPQIPRETQVRERVPAVRTALRRRVARIERQGNDAQLQRRQEWPTCVCRCSPPRDAPPVSPRRALESPNCAKRCAERTPHE